MQQPVNYGCPQIYWVDNSATSSWAPPGSVFPCPSSVPGRPDQRRPPPPPPPIPPPSQPPPSPPPPLPPMPPLKKRKDHSIDQWLPVIFFMVVAALVGLGLGMYQLFHLQKELAELRELTNQSLKVSSFEKQICAVFWFSKKFRRLLQGSGNSDDEKKLARLESAKTSVKVVFGGPVVADLAVQPAFPPVQ
ncbi:Fas ligand (TNF superfamily member 6) [Cricetulus griseus]